MEARGELPEIGFTPTGVVVNVGADVGWIDKEEGVGGILVLKDALVALIFYNHAIQPSAGQGQGAGDEFTGERPRFSYFCHAEIFHIAAEGLAIAQEEIDGAFEFGQAGLGDGGEEEFAAGDALGQEALHLRSVALGAKVEADEIAVEVVDDFEGAARFGKEDGQAAGERFTIAFVRGGGQAGQEVFEEARLAAGPLQDRFAAFVRGPK